MISFLWYGGPILLPSILFVMRRYIGYAFFLITGRWPGRAKDGSYLAYPARKRHALPRNDSV
jgi:hypothetical protein